MIQTGIIILAAGSSSRLGRPKQLLIFQNKSLIAHITDEAVKAKLHPVVVITGACAGEVSLTLNSKPVTIVFNEAWQEGMASGIVAGVSALLALNSGLASLITAVCDQPFVSAALFEELLQKKKATAKGIIACAYADTIGTPVLFDRGYFRYLQKLKGPEGAKVVVKKYKDDVATIPFPQGGIDIDTEADYGALLKLQRRT